ncbi:MAG: hypothetical protein KatS3mg011_0563 [Acidimicrobiia bacterium]|nr:MAG: hypothetical protein KatS3mg011_0563 [Acidimicrobiia bacterium]
MSARHRAAFALSLLLLVSLFGGTGLSRAQVEEAERQAEQAEAELDEAYRIVSEAVADRQQVELALFDALTRYEQAAAELAVASAALERIERSLLFAEAEAASAERGLQTQAAAAYMEAVTSMPNVVLASSSVEEAIFVGAVFEASQEDTLARLAELAVVRRELDQLRSSYQAEKERVEGLATELQLETEQLRELFAQADARVAEAFDRALQAEADYRAALDDVARARAAEEEERRRAQATTTTTTVPPTNGATPPTTQPPRDDEPPSIRIGPATERWRPIVETHFASDLVEDALVIMECESGGDPEAVNPYSGAAGLYQFLPATWAVASVKAGVGDRSVFDGEANIIAASWLAEYYRQRGYDPWLPWTCRAYL